MGFTADSQLLSPRLRRGEFLWVSLQILNYCHPARGGLDFYGFHCRFSLIVTPPEAGWIFMAFTWDFQLLSFLCIVITKGPYANYDQTQWFLKYIQPAFGGLDKSFINIYVWWLLSSSTFFKNDGTQWFLTNIQPTKGGLDKFFINIYVWWLLSSSTFFKNDGTQWFLKYI